MRPFCVVHRQNVVTGRDRGVALSHTQQAGCDAALPGGVEAMRWISEGMVLRPPDRLRLEERATKIDFRDDMREGVPGFGMLADFPAAGIVGEIEQTVGAASQRFISHAAQL